MKQGLKQVKTLLVLIAAAALFTLAGCNPFQIGNDPAANESGPTEPADLMSGLADGSSKKVPVWGYQYGTGLGLGDGSFLMQEYKDWKGRYVVAGDVGKRVQRDYGDGLTPYDTVSEGQAYGMLLAVYFDDQATFDQLLKFALAHTVSSERSIMHWKINSNYRNVNEFGFETGTGFVYYGLKEIIPGMVRMTTDSNSNPKYYIKKNQIYIDLNGNPAPSDTTIFVKAAENTRAKSSATDADLDMAVSLIFAYKRWGDGGTIKYSKSAFDMVSDVLEADITEDGWLKAGSQWGGQGGWNPSYYIPGYFRLIDKFMHSSASMASTYVSSGYIDIVNNVLANMDAQMAIIDNANQSAGLFPDWVVTSGTSTVKKTETGDRKYFETNNTSFMNQVVDRDRNGVINEKDTFELQSFNFYYDAVRVPWRLAMDYAWYGTQSSKKMTDELAAFFHGKINTFVDGYSITGGSWKWEDRDGFNNGKPPAGRNDDNPSITFLAMLGTAQLAYDRTEAKIWYDKIKAKEETDTNYHYYGNTLRLMSLLYLSGYMTNLWSCAYYSTAAAPVSEKYYRIRNCEANTFYLNTLEGLNSRITASAIADSPTSSKTIWKVKDKTVGGTTYKLFSPKYQPMSSSSRYLRTKTDDYIYYQGTQSTDDTAYYWKFEPAGSGYYRMYNKAKNGYLYLPTVTDPDSYTYVLITKSGKLPEGKTGAWEFELVE